MCCGRLHFDFTESISYLDIAFRNGRLATRVLSLPLTNSQTTSYSLTARTRTCAKPVQVTHPRLSPYYDAQKDRSSRL